MPHLAAVKPHVGQFHLLALHYLLAEKSVFVSYGKAHSRIVERGKTVHKAGGEPSESAVAQSRVGLELVKPVELKAHFAESLSRAVFKPEIVKVVL